MDTDKQEKPDRMGEALVAVQTADTAYLAWKTAQLKADNLRRIYHEVRDRAERLTGQWGPLWAQEGDGDAGVVEAVAPEASAATVVGAAGGRDHGVDGQDVGELA